MADIFNPIADPFNSGTPTVEQWAADRAAGKTQATSFEQYKAEVETRKQEEYAAHLKEFNTINAPFQGTNPDGSLKINFGSENQWQTPQDSAIQNQNVGNAQNFAQANLNPTTQIQNQIPIDPALEGLQEDVEDTEEQPLERPPLWQTLLNTPGLGMPIDLKDKFMIAGQSFAFDPSYMGENSEINKRAKRVSRLTGIAALGSGILGAAKGYLTGRGLQKRQNAGLQNYYDNFRNYGVNNYKFGKGGPFDVFENGGVKDIFDADFEDLMLDENIYGLPPALVENFASAEVEDEEWVKNLAEDKWRKAVGPTHEDGGIKVAMLPGDTVISDNLKITPTQARECSKEYDLNIKPTMTYAAVVDLYTDKIKLTEKNEELKNLYKQVDKLKDIKDEATKEINLTFLNKKIMEKEQERAPLLERRKQFAEKIYEKQEASKNTFRDGGVFKGSVVDALARKYNLTTEKALEILQDLPQFKDGGAKANKDAWISAKIKKLMEEGKPQKQAIAIAFSMWEDMNKENGGKKLPKYENGHWAIPHPGDKNNKFNASSMTPEEIEQLAAQLGYEGENGKKTIKGFQEFILTNPELSAKVKELHTQYGMPAAKTEADGMWGVRWDVLKAIDPVTKEIKKEAVVPPAVGIDGSPIIPLDIKNRMKMRSQLFVPGTPNLAPEALMPHAKLNYRAETVDPFAISPDENLREINRTVDANNASLDYLPIGMRGAAGANNTALALDASNKAITDANQYNAANRQQTEQFNVQNENQARLFNQKEIPRYEELQLTAVDKTLNDYHNYFNAQYRNQINRYNYITSAGIIDSMFDNVGFDPFGRPEVDMNTFVPYTKPQGF